MAEKKYCPRCNNKMPHQEDDGYHVAFWYCVECKFAIADTESNKEPMEYKL